jgi:hypothetical protein
MVADKGCPDEDRILTVLVVSRVDKLEESLEDIRITIRQIDGAANRFLEVGSCQRRLAVVGGTKTVP